MFYTEDVDRALKICRTEKAMRESVFRNDYNKKQLKVAEMEFVMDLLRNYKKTLSSRTGDLFSG